MHHNPILKEIERGPLIVGPGSIFEHRGERISSGPEVDVGRPNGFGGVERPPSCKSETVIRVIGKNARHRDASLAAIFGSHRVGDGERVRGGDGKSRETAGKPAVDDEICLGGVVTRESVFDLAPRATPITIGDIRVFTRF